MKQLIIGALALCILSPTAHAQQFQFDAGQMQGAVQGMLMQSMFKITDANQDGKVSRQEALATAAKRFDESDTNKDGFMTKEEMQTAHQKQMQMRQQRQQMKQQQGGGMQGMHHKGMKMHPPSSSSSTVTQ